MTEQEAFDRLKEGDRTALAWVYRNYRDGIAHFFMGSYAGCDATEAGTIAQDAVMQLAESLEKGKMTQLNSKLLTLLVGIAKNQYAAAKRKKQLPYKNWNPIEIPSEEGEDPFNDDFANRLAREELLEQLEPIVKKMKEPCRTILTDFYWGDKTDRAIGTQLGKTREATTMKRLHCIELMRRFFSNHKK